MTKNEKIEMMKLKVNLRSALNNLKACALDYDCKWPYSIVNQLKECLELIDKFKI